MKQSLFLCGSICSVLLSAPIVSAKNSSAEKRPNILFCIADDATFDYFGAAGCSWVNTPNYDRLAAEGLFVANCYTPNAKSAPSRACVLTGRNSWQLGAAGNHINQFPSDVKAFTEVLSESGYSVFFTGKGCTPCNPGVVNGAPRELTGRAYNKHKSKKLTTGISATDYAANIDQFFEDRGEDDSPFFCWFGSNQPHRKYEFMSGVTKGGKSLDMIDVVPPYWPDTDSVRHDMLDYALEVEEWYEEYRGHLFACYHRGRCVAKRAYPTLVFVARARA
ncbi:MAG: sulfatase-like hydrolase/transferase [Rikenellaceae bacterium]